MAQFKCTISDAGGKIISKTISALSREAAQKMLEKEGKIVVSLQESKQRKKWWEWGGSLSQKDILLIARRISDMTNRGFSVLDALHSIELQAQNPKLKEVVQHVKHQIELGNSLSDALAEYPQYFSNVYISLVKVGEESGNLPKVLSQLEKQERQMYQLKKKALAALIYPAIILTLMIVIGIGLVLFLIPFLRDIFAGFTAALPLPTRVLLATELFLRQYWWMLILGILGFAVSLKIFFSNPHFVRVWDKGFIKVPILGSYIKSYNSAQIIRTFSTLNKSEIPLVQSLEILATVPRNTSYRDIIRLVREDVNKGTIFSAAIEKHGHLFSPLVIESIKLGEQTGNLSDSMTYLAEVFEEDLKNNLTMLTKFIQPFLLVILGIMVTLFALAVIVPLQRIPTLMQQR